MLIKLLKIVKIYLVLNVLVMSGFAQSKLPKITISYNSSISDKMISSKKLKEVNWTIFKLNNQKIVSEGQGESLLDFIFEQPEEYEIHFELPAHEVHTDECYHPDLPEKLQLSVNDKSITYLVEEAKLSEKIKADKDVSGITLSIPVEIKTFNNENVEVPAEVFTSGINTTIKGTLQDSQTMLGSGNYILKYSLTGKASKDTYISFDFTDFKNSNQLFYYQEKIE